MSARHTIAELAGFVGGELRGEGAAIITGVAEVSEAGPGEATWVSRSEYESRLPKSLAGVVLVPKDFGATPMPAILCDNIERGVGNLLAAFAKPVSKPDPGIHPTAVIHPSVGIGSNPRIGAHVVIECDVRIGASCVIHAGVFIGQGSSLGDDCCLWPNVVVRDGCKIGSRVVIHPNSVIGSDGFGFYFDGKHNRYPHIGGVRIEDDVEIGACTCVDRSKFGHTVVGRGTKIDNLCQIAHNVRIGQHVIMTGKVGIGGSTLVGDGCVIGGGSLALDNVELGAGVRVAAQSIITKDIPAGLTVFGYPAQDIRRERRERAAVRKLPELLDQVQSLLARVEQLEAAAHDNH